MGCTLAHQPAALSVRASQILLVDTWDAHQRPNMSLAPAPGDQRTQQHLDVDSVGLNSSPAPVYLEAARVDHKALDAAPHKEPRQPERVIAYFVADGYCWRRNRSPWPSSPGLQQALPSAFPCFRLRLDRGSAAPDPETGSPKASCSCSAPTRSAECSQKALRVSGPFGCLLRL